MKNKKMVMVLMCTMVLFGFKIATSRNLQLVGKVNVVNGLKTVAGRLDNSSVTDQLQVCVVSPVLAVNEPVLVVSREQYTVGGSSRYLFALNSSDF